MQRYSQELIDTISSMLKRLPERRPNSEEILQMSIFDRKKKKNFLEVGFKSKSAFLVAYLI